MKILVDENFALIDELIKPIGQVISKPGRSISADDLHDIDVLLIRSVTKVDSSLLQCANRLKFVGSATIGSDHVDQQLLLERGIDYAFAPGCNAEAVADYVLASLITVMGEDFFNALPSVGLVGYGNTSQAVAKRLQAIGTPWIACDPLRTEQHLVSLDEVLQCDVVSLHVPLTKDTEYPTYHLINADVLAQMAPEQVLLNCCRGAVIDSSVVVEKPAGELPRLIFDVWEYEPDIDARLFEKVLLGTPHIAGYSMKGKLNGSLLVYQQMASSLLKHEIKLPKVEVSDYDCSIDLNPVITDLQSLCSFVAEFSQLKHETDSLSTKINSGLLPGAFDQLRKDYNLRYEFTQCNLTGKYSDQLSERLDALGFN